MAKQLGPSRFWVRALFLFTTFEWCLSSKLLLRRMGPDHGWGTPAGNKGG